MAQNVYDRPEFFEGYSLLRRSLEGLDGAPEWPTLRAMLPGLSGLRVADLGSGYGWFSRWAAAQGAASVLALDLSAKMLERARAQGVPPGVSYECADLDRLTLEANAFDLVYSSLAFHYVADADRLYRMIAAALVPGGRLVFSTEHPIYMASENADWVQAPTGRHAWPVSEYFREGERVSDWLSKGVVKYHRTIGTTFAALTGAGLCVERLVEFCPSPEQVAEQPGLAEEADRPMFLLIAATR